MEALVSAAVGAMTAAGVYLILRRRSFPVILGLTMLSYAVNVFLAAAGRLTVNRPPILGLATGTADPLPQALVLTAIVISFGMTAVLVTMAVAAYAGTGSDAVNDDADQGPP